MLSKIILQPIIHKENFHFKSILDYSIYILFCVFSLVDCLTGLLLQIGLPSIGVPFKLFLLFLLFLGMKSEIKISSILFFLALFWLCTLVYLDQSYTNFSTSLSMMLKILMFPFVYFYMSETYSKMQNSTKILDSICFVNFMTIFINQILGLLGYGFKTYSDGGFGIKGFYYDGNAMAVVCFCLFVFYFSVKKNNKYAFIMTICSFLLGTKTAILAIFLYFFAVIFVRSSRRMKIFILILFCISIVIFSIIIQFTDLLSYQIERIKWLYQSMEGNILSVILSGRNIDLKNHKNFFYEHLSIKQILFGYGYRNDTKIIELDFFDTLFSYGLLFCSAISFLYLYPLYKNRKNIECVIFNLLIILITFTSGHVWFNTSTSLFFVINNIYFWVKLDEKNLLCN